jgi:hypothetical protein
MRLIPRPALTLPALALATLTFGAGAAQAQRVTPSSVSSARNFEDSWFWGAKGGVSHFSSATETLNAPVVGGEWLITRQRVGLYISVEQSFFDTRAAVFDPSSLNSARAVDISDLRRYNAQLFAFPVQLGALRPYAGLGFAISVIQSADPRGTFSSSDARDSVFMRVDDQTSRTSLALTGGVQAQWSRLGAFVQATTMPTRSRFLINGASNTSMIEAGLRIRVTKAVEPM